MYLLGTIPVGHPNLGLYPVHLQETLLVITMGQVADALDTVTLSPRAASSSALVVAVIVEVSRCSHFVWGTSIFIFFLSATFRNDN